MIDHNFSPFFASSIGGPSMAYWEPKSIGQVVLKVGQSLEASQQLARVVYVAWLIRIFEDRLEHFLKSFSFFLISEIWKVHEE